MEGYLPQSEFLRAILHEEIPLDEEELLADNLQRLIALTRDADKSNRDWAMLFLHQTELDTPEVRQALIDGTNDEDVDVRAEALVGIASRDRAIALPLVKRELDWQLETGGIYRMVLEAALLVAHRDLLPLLRCIEEEFDLTEWDYSDKCFNQELAAAIHACETGIVPE